MLYDVLLVLTEDLLRYLWLAWSLATRTIVACLKPSISALCILWLTVFYSLAFNKARVRRSGIGLVSLELDRVCDMLNNRVGEADARTLLCWRQTLTHSLVRRFDVVSPPALTRGSREATLERNHNTLRRWTRRRKSNQWKSIGSQLIVSKWNVCNKSEHVLLHQKQRTCQKMDL